ncbi:MULTISPECIES: phage holin family protein [Bacillaceae]|uniref:phage holin family protein n=1 Tax=Bacillales TaxID=1385 RepID=UPI001883400E|nr:MULTISPECIES: phage holin family protein [Bacillaceae]MBF0705662.1 phage holin family protein [Pseudalkalibacillus hwajinpoensis]MDO6657878.1 phage holin family protein [Anaerobacillus sp. 1_MG-2023]
MRHWIVSLLVNSIVLMVVAGYFEGFYLQGIGSAILASVLLAIVNVFVKPILILLTLPVTIVTLGLFLIVINAITLMITAFLMGEAFVIDGFMMAILAALIIGLLNLLIDKVIIEPIRNKA